MACWSGRRCWRDDVGTEYIIKRDLGKWEIVEQPHASGTRC
eukprot:gene11650-15267_t